ncbi:MAG: YbaY family lipoprotein [Planctomycetaceae bacterium]|nr:YbaY family lipoprotein [Planctomycetaceae bacterium]
MKRTSHWVAVFSVASTLVGLSTAQAIDPVNTGNTNSTIPQGQYSGSLTVDPYATNPMGGAFQDPFFNPNGYFDPRPQVPGQSGTTGTTPNYGSVFTPNPVPTQPSTVTVPNPNPNQYSTDPRLSRDRIDTRIAPETPAGPTSRRWRLGVYSKDSDTGVRIVQVVPNSAASRARLEAEDVIVSVNGYQVGYVNGALYDCSTEFERRADKDGWVSLLVQNNRDRSLVNVPLQLESRLQKIQGTLGLDPRNLPRDSVVQVELREIVRPEAPPVTLANTYVEDRRTYPLPFEIEFDPMQIDSRRTYVVTAKVTKADRVLYETRQNYQVLAPGQPKQVALALEQVQTPINPNPGPRTPLDRNQQMAQIRQWFNSYLGRTPTDRELTLWMQALDSGYSLPDVQVELLSNNQLFNQCNRDKENYIRRIHEFMIGRGPTPEEMSYWMSRYDESGGLRRDFAREFQEAVSAR